MIFQKIGYHSIRANNYNIKGVHMIKLLIGKPGSGKTKEMIKHANEALKTAKGTILFINESNDSMLEIHHDIRYINISEYPIESSQEIIPFIYGLLSTNHDISKIYLDGLFNIYIMTHEEACKWLEQVKELSNKYNLEIELSLNVDGDIPECFKPFI